MSTRSLVLVAAFALALVAIGTVFVLTSDHLDNKAAVLSEIARVLKPGGRLGISDVVAEDRLSPEERAARGTHVGCIAGALSRGEYEAGLDSAGFEHVSVDFTHEVADGMHGAVIKGIRKATMELPVVAAATRAGCC